MRTSYKKNRPFDFKLIDLVEPNAVIYKRQPGLSNYETMKAKNEIWEKIAEEMGREVQFCLMRWNNLRYQYQKELRRTTELCPKFGVIRGSTWPYLDRLSFLKNINNNKAKNNTKIENEPTVITINESNTWQCVVSDDDLHIDVDNDSDQIANISNSIAEQEISRSKTPDQFQENSETQLVLNQNNNIDTDSQRAYSIIEEYVEMPNEEIIEEEIIYEDEESITATPTLSHSDEADILIDSMPGTNMQKMNSLLSSIHGINLEHAERRIMAYLLKCQLRALMCEKIDDIEI